MNICDLYNDKRVEETLKERLNSLRDTNDILELVYKNLDPKTIVSKTENVIVIKIDRRKNKDNILEGIKNNIIESIGCDEEMNLLLRIYEEGNEVIIKKRRERY